MRIAETIETYGYFWLPDEPEVRMSGILTISERGEASLELFGSFDSFLSRAGTKEADRQPRIWGVTAKGGDVTLVDCIVAHQSETLVSTEHLSKSSWHLGWVFWGIHFDEEELYLSGMEFSVEGLDEWFLFHHRAFSSSGDPRGEFWTKFTPLKPIRFQLPDDLMIGFHMLAHHSGGMFHHSTTTRTAITIESHQVRKFSDLMQVLHRVRNFLCLAFDRIVSFTSVNGFRREPDVRHASGDIVSVYSKLGAYDLAEQEIGVGEFLIAYEDVADKIHDCLTRWLDSYEEYEPTFNLYFAVAANQQMHLEARFLFLVHGIESLHRRSSSATTMPPEEFDSILASVLESTPKERREWLKARLRYANELSLRQRIRELISPFGALFGAENARESFVSAIVNTRNYFTHYDYSIRNEAVTDPIELLDLYSKLEGLLQLHLLELVGFEHEHITRIVSQYPPLREKLKVE